jgi:predicted  nucleic acid-binding Zn-ribbon protein
MHKLQAQLKSLHEQLQVNSVDTIVSQEFKQGVDASHKLCFDVARKIEQEQSALRDDVEILTKDKSQLMKENDQYRKVIERLEKELVSERG